MTFSEYLKQFYRFLVKQKSLYNNYKIRQVLSKTTGFYFSQDYVSGHIGNWTKWFNGSQGKPNQKMLEVGSFEGRSTVWFAENVFTDTTSTITCIDIFSDGGRESVFDHNVERHSNQIIKYKGRSEEILPTLNQAAYDIIYIDGSHHSLNVLMDAHLCWRLLKQGGLMLFDDYLWEMQKPIIERPQLAIDLFLEAYQEKLEIVHKGYQLLLKKIG